MSSTLQQPLKPRTPQRSPARPVLQQLLPRSHSATSLARQVRGHELGSSADGRLSGEAGLLGFWLASHPASSVPAEPLLLSAPPPPTLQHPDGLLERLHGHRPLRNALLLLLSLVLAANAVWAVQGVAAWRCGLAAGAGGSGSGGGAALRGGAGEELMLQRLNSTTLAVEVRSPGCSNACRTECGLLLCLPHADAPRPWRPLQPTRRSDR